MREVKFRGKRVDNGEWAYGYIVKTFTERCFILTGNDEYFKENIWSINPKHEDFIISEFYEVNERTVGQCTGLKDRNNISIFEFDVIRLSKDLTATVRYNERMARFEIKYNETTTNQATPLGDWIENYEVINNY